MADELHEASDASWLGNPQNQLLLLVLGAVAVGLFVAFKNSLGGGGASGGGTTTYVTSGMSGSDAAAIIAAGGQAQTATLNAQVAETQASDATRIALAQNATQYRLGTQFLRDQMRATAIAARTAVTVQKAQDKTALQGLALQNKGAEAQQRIAGANAAKLANIQRELEQQVAYFAEQLGMTQARQQTAQVQAQAGAVTSVANAQASASWWNSFFGWLPNPLSFFTGGTGAAAPPPTTVA